jgi:dihydrodipicolinate synthase/N-acetylneuraminate lyase
MRRMPMDRVEGLLPVMPTPFREGQVDAEGIESLVAWVAPHVRGITVLGSSGESGYLTPADRRRALAAFAEAASRHDLAMVVGVTDAATTGAVEFVRSNEAAAASAFLVLPPTYYPPTLAATERHLAAVADAAAGRPLVLYDIPGLSGLGLGRADVMELVERVPAISHAKLSKLDLDGIAPLAADGRITLLAGYDEIAHEQVVEGCRGVMVPFVVMCPEPSARWFTELTTGDKRLAFSIFMDEIFPLIRAMVGADVDFIGVVKLYAQRLGVIASAETALGLPELSAARARQVEEHFAFMAARYGTPIPG